MDIRIKIRSSDDPTQPAKILPKTPQTYEELVAQIKLKFSALTLLQSFTLTYKDGQGDLIELSDDSDLMHAYHAANQLPNKELSLILNLNAKSMAE